MTKQNYMHVIGCRSRDSNQTFKTHLAEFACLMWRTRMMQ